MSKTTAEYHSRPCNGDTMLRRVRNCRFIIIINVKDIAVVLYKIKPRDRNADSR